MALISQWAISASLLVGKFYALGAYSRITSPAQHRPDAPHTILIATQKIPKQLAIVNVCRHGGH